MQFVIKEKERTLIHCKSTLDIKNINVPTRVHQRSHGHFQYRKVITNNLIKIQFLKD